MIGNKNQLKVCSILGKIFWTFKRMTYPMYHHTSCISLVCLSFLRWLRKLAPRMFFSCTECKRHSWNKSTMFTVSYLFKTIIAWLQIQLFTFELSSIVITNVMTLLYMNIILPFYLSCANHDKSNYLQNINENYISFLYINFTKILSKIVSFFWVHGNESEHEQTNCVNQELQGILIRFVCSTLKFIPNVPHSNSFPMSQERKYSFLIYLHLHQTKTVRH